MCVPTESWWSWCSESRWPSEDERIGVVFNGKEYGGSFYFSLSFPQLVLTLGACTAPIILHNESSKPPVRFSQYVSELWHAMKTRVVYQIVFYSFFIGIFTNFSYTAASLIQLYMVGVSPINNTISDTVGNAVFMGGIVLTGKYGLNWNWRTMTVRTGVLLPIALNVPAGISFLISTFVTVELVGEGHEGAMYGLITTVANLAAPFAATLTKIVDNRLWNLSNERVQVDDCTVRRDMTEAVLFMYGMSVVSWFFLFRLPRQKPETQELKRRGGSSALLGALTVGYFFVALVWSVTTNIMGIFPSTSCLVIAGGMDVNLDRFLLRNVFRSRKHSYKTEGHCICKSTKGLKSHGRAIK
ncbi:Major facilitator superfamily domain [Phytophthora cactorum]|nr:Major facilitator superfamily domain [Phytophthora cactorum]